jgi:hypothetical protein
VKGYFLFLNLISFQFSIFSNEDDVIHCLNHIHVIQIMKKRECVTSQMPVKAFKLPVKYLKWQQFFATDNAYLIRIVSVY